MHQHGAVGAKFALGAIQSQHSLALAFRNRLPPLLAIAGFFMPPTIRRRQRGAGDPGYLGLAAGFLMMAVARSMPVTSDINPNFGKSELLSFLKFRNIAACWITE